MNDKQPSPVEILLVEDNPDYVVLIKAMIKESRPEAFRSMVINLNHAASLHEAEDYLGGGHHCDMVLFDLTLPDSQAVDTIGRMAPYAARIPLIVLTSHSDAALAIEALKKGSQDYLVKSELNPVLLFRSICYAVERFNICKEREKIIADLQITLAKVKVLGELISVCMYCKRARIDNGYWAVLENYLRQYSLTQFTHDICPECAKKHRGHDVDDLKSK